MTCFWVGVIRRFEISSYLYAHPREVEEGLDFLNTEDGGTASYPERLEFPEAMCLRIWCILDVCLPLLFRFFPPLTSVCTCRQYIKLCSVFGRCGRLNPTEKEHGDPDKAEDVPQTYEHNFAQSFSVRDCMSPCILNLSFDRSDTAARFSLLDSECSCPT